MRSTTVTRPSTASPRLDADSYFLGSRPAPRSFARRLPLFEPSFRLAYGAGMVRPSSAATDPAPLPTLTDPMVSRYLYVIAGLVFSIVVVGGLTRLTESGLSITEWNLVSGTLPPLTEAEWEAEFAKYRETPEWRLLNRHIDLESFKYIYRWEWAHRFLGRVIGAAFLLPIPYFVLRGRLSRPAKSGLFAIATLIGGQGALGWYMVKSGLDQAQLDGRDGVPRVSQYRLAAHLGMAFAVYAACLRLGGGAARDWKLVRRGLPLGRVQASAAESVQVLDGPVARRTRALVTGLTALVFTTAISGPSRSLDPFPLAPTTGSAKVPSSPGSTPVCSTTRSR